MSNHALLSRRSVLAAGVLLGATGCARAAGAGSSAELVWGIGGIDVDSAQDVIAQWDVLHPQGPKVRLDRLALSTYEQRQLMALELNAGLSQLDILTLDVVWIPEFAQRGWLVDLQELRPQIEQASLPAPVQAGVWNRTLWAAPSTTDAGILYYRSDLVDTPPATWEELIDVGRRIGERNGIAPFVAADGAQVEGLVVHYLEYFWGLGGDVLDRDGRTVLFQLDKAEQALEFMRKAFREGIYAPGFNTMKQEDARKTFESGDAVFLRSWPYTFQHLTGGDPDSQVGGKIGIAPLPVFAGHRPVTALGGHNLAVNAFSRNIPAAIEFVRYASASQDLQPGLPRRYSTAPTLKSVYRDRADDPIIALLAKVLPTAKPRPATPQWATVSAEMQQQIYTAYATPDRQPRAAVEALRDFLVATVEKG